ncbi:ABC transporter permease subunit, partial [Burkholderia sp. SIMBA_045]
MDILRGLPPVLTILVIGFGFSPIMRQLTGSTSPYPMAIAALSLMSGAYIGEIFRSGIQSVDKGQLEATRALGFGYGPS